MIGRESRSRINKIQKSRLKYILVRETPGKGANSGDSGFSWALRYARQKNILDLPVNFRCFENRLGLCSHEHGPILLLKRWRPRIRLPRRKRPKRLQQLELNLWPKTKRK
jgi:hypothetical protein